MTTAASIEAKGRIATIVWALAMVVAVAVLSFLGFILAVGAAEATPEPSGLHLAINRIIVATGLIAVCSTGAAGILSPSRRKAAMFTLAGFAVALGALIVVLVAQQG